MYVKNIDIVNRIHAFNKPVLRKVHKARHSEKQKFRPINDSSKQYDDIKKSA